MVTNTLKFNMFAFKHYVRHKVHLVAGGHITDPNTTDSQYSSEVLLHSICISNDAGELNILFLMVGDISSAYLEGLTLEKICLIAGSECGPHAGHRLTIVCALFGLCISGAHWHDRLPA
jgi:hypothetical protein